MASNRITRLVQLGCACIFFACGSYGYEDRIDPLLGSQLRHIVFVDATYEEVLEFFRKKGIEELSRQSNGTKRILTFEWSFDPMKHRARVNYEKAPIEYGRALTDVLRTLDLQFKLVAPNRIRITDASK